jgi:hypothetical protein
MFSQLVPYRWPIGTFASDPIAFQSSEEAKDFLQIASAKISFMGSKCQQPSLEQFWTRRSSIFRESVETKNLVRSRRVVGNKRALCSSPWSLK